MAYSSTKRSHIPLTKMNTLTENKQPIWNQCTQNDLGIGASSVESQ
jgi:hypothetical protein